MANFQRKPNRLAAHCYLGFGEYFLTLCTGDRKRLFDSRALIDALLAALRETSSTHHVGISAYCFMPDHLHLLAQAQSKDCNLVSFVKAFKGRGTVAARPFGIRHLWQKGYYDHLIRNSQSAVEVASYIFLNPVRAGLTRTAWEWPHSGSFTFDWKRLPTPVEGYTPPWKKKKELVAT